MPVVVTTLLALGLQAAALLVRRRRPIDRDGAVESATEPVPASAVRPASEADRGRDAA